MTISEAISNLKRGKSIPYKHETLAMAIKSLEAWEKVKQDLYKFANDSLDTECAECYRIALRCVEGHLKEVENG